MQQRPAPTKSFSGPCPYQAIGCRRAKPGQLPEHILDQDFLLGVEEHQEHAEASGARQALEHLLHQRRWLRRLCCAGRGAQELLGEPVNEGVCVE